MGWWNSLDNDNKLIFAIIIAGALLMVVVIFIILCIVCRRKRVEDKCKYQPFIFHAPSFIYFRHHLSSFITCKILCPSFPCSHLHENYHFVRPVANKKLKRCIPYIYACGAFCWYILKARTHVTKVSRIFYMCDSRPSQYITNRFLFSMLLVNVCMRRTYRGVCSFCVRLLSLTN